MLDNHFSCVLINLSTNPPFWSLTNLMGGQFEQGIGKVKQQSEAGLGLFDMGEGLHQASFQVVQPSAKFADPHAGISAEQLDMHKFDQANGSIYASVFNQKNDPARQLGVDAADASLKAFLNNDEEGAFKHARAA